MNKKYSVRFVVGMLAGALLLSLPVVPSFAGTVSEEAPPADTLNPAGENPHANDPRVRITQQQREAAAAARKQKQVEIDARKKARESGAAVQGDAAVQGNADAQNVDDATDQPPTSEVDTK